MERSKVMRSGRSAAAFSRVGAVHGFATNFKVVEFEERANGAPDDDFVFNDKNALGHRKVDRG